MNVALFAGLDTDHAYSMRKYATGLADALQAVVETRFLQENGFLEHSFQLYYGPGIRLPFFLNRSKRLAALANEGLATHVLYPREARGKQADVNHVLDHSCGSLVAALPPEHTVVTCHDLIPLEVPDIHPTFYSRMTGQRWYRKSVAAMTRAARIIAISEHTKKDLVKHTGYNPDKIVVIPHGIDRRFKPSVDRAQQQQTRQWLGAPADCKMVLHVGDCAPYKNLPGLLRTFALVRHKVREPVCLIRVGPPFTSSQLRLVKQLKLGGCILRKESLPLDDLVSLYNIADVLLFPSLYEGLGLPVAEAMACGLPVVASHAASIPEVLGEGQLTFAPDDVEGMADAVVGLLENAALRQALIEKGLRRARHFSWPLVAEQVFAVYEEVWKDASSHV
ncbi:MAG: glycosyltransferase family 4 protein [Chloroflexi bacterium]|nr:glycosyltransferase family 4 protein [Chloroflexota bacterium]